MADTTTDSSGTASPSETSQAARPRARDLVGDGRPAWPEVPGHRHVQRHAWHFGTRRWRILGVIVGVLALAVLALGFVFSSAVIAVVHPEDPDLDLVVHAVDRNPDRALVTIAATDDALLPVVGLRTEDGYGQLADIVEHDDEWVTRLYQPLAGSLPDAGDRAATDVYAYPDQPLFEAAEVDVATATPVDAVGAPAHLPAWWLDAGTDRAVVYVHGRGATRAEGWRIARIANSAGWSVLLVSHRGDGIAPDPADAIGGFGTREWPDLDTAVRWLEGEGIARVALAGSSQGALVAANWWEHAGRDATGGPEVVGAVFDSGMLSLHGTLRQQARNRSIPGPFIRPILWATFALASLRAELDAVAAEPLFRAEDWELPTLLLHGEADDQVPDSISVEFAQDAPDADLSLFSAGHIRAFNQDPQRYRDLVTAFLAEVG